jgi:hypothetical protein
VRDVYRMWFWSLPFFFYGLLYLFRARRRWNWELYVFDRLDGGFLSGVRTTPRTVLALGLAFLSVGLVIFGFPFWLQRRELARNLMNPCRESMKGMDLARLIGTAPGSVEAKVYEGSCYLDFEGAPISLQVNDSLAYEHESLQEDMPVYLNGDPQRAVPNCGDEAMIVDGGDAWYFLARSGTAGYLLSYYQKDAEEHVLKLAQHLCTRIDVLQTLAQTRREVIEEHKRRGTYGWPAY